MKINEIRSLTINSVVANKLNHYKIVSINKEDDKIVSFELKPMYAQLWTDPQNKTIKINSMRNYNLIELAEEPQEVEEPQEEPQDQQEEQEPVQTTLDTIKVVRLTDSKNGTFKKGEIYEAIKWGNHNYKIKVEGAWIPSPKSNWIKNEGGHSMKKINEELYIYKGINITKDHRGYHCSILTEKCKLPIRIDSPTQQGLKNILNRTIREYGIIKDG